MISTTIEDKKATEEENNDMKGMNEFQKQILKINELSHDKTKLTK